MDQLVSQLILHLHFFSTGLGVLVIGTIAALIFLIWDWRFALAGLLFIQVGVAVLVVQVHGLPVRWATVQIFVMGLSILLLGLSVNTLGFPRAQRPGSLLLRGLALVLLVVSWRHFNLNLAVPVVVPLVTQLFIWLALCALVILSLGDRPFFTGVALLLWCVPVQAVVEVVIPGHGLFVLIGILQLFTALACSYMFMVEQTPAVEQRSIFTDVTFPSAVPVTPALPTQEQGRLNKARAPGTISGRSPALAKDPTTEISLSPGGSQWPTAHP